MGHPELDLSSKTAVVIGGTSGIGLAIARGLAKAGANVVPTGRRQELVDSAAEQIKNLGRQTLAVPCDVTSHSSVQALCSAARTEFGEVHGFLSGWCYWTNNLFYVPVLLVYMAGILAFAG